MARRTGLLTGWPRSKRYLLRSRTVVLRKIRKSQRNRIVAEREIHHTQTLGASRFSLITAFLLAVPGCFGVSSNLTSSNDVTLALLVSFSNAPPWTSCWVSADSWTLRVSGVWWQSGGVILGLHWCRTALFRPISLLSWITSSKSLLAASWMIRGPVLDPARTRKEPIRTYGELL